MRKFLVGVLILLCLSYFSLIVIKNNINSALDIDEITANRLLIAGREQIFESKEGDYKISYLTRPEQYMLQDLQINIFIDEVKVYTIYQDKLYVIGKNGEYLISKDGEIRYSSDSINPRWRRERKNFETITEKIEIEKLSNEDQEIFNKILNYYTEYKEKKGFNPHVRIKK